VVEPLTAALDRPVEIDGPVRVQFLPQPGLALEDVRIADGQATGDLARIARVEAVLALAPLFRGEIVIDRLILDGAEIDLAVDGDGQANWRSAAADPATSGASPPRADSSAPGDGGGLVVRLDDVRVHDGIVRYHDAGSDLRLSFDDIEATATLGAIGDPIEVKLAAVFDGRPLTAAVDLNSPDSLTAEGTATLVATVESQGSVIGFDGTISRPGDASGELHVATDEATAIARWLGESEGRFPVERLDLQGQIAAGADPPSVAVQGLTGSVDGVEIMADLAMAIDAGRPALSGRIEAGVVDLRELARDTETVENLARPPPATPTPPPSGEDAPAAAPPSAPALADESTADALPLDLAVALEVDGIIAPPLRFGRGRADLVGDADTLTVTIDRLALYGGSAEGVIVVRPTRPDPTFDATLRAADVAVADVLQATAGRAGLNGRGTLDLRVAGAGRTTRAFISSTNGDGRLAIRDASPSGLGSVPALAPLLELVGTSAAGDVTATFTLRKGVLANDDLVAKTAAVTLGGEGTVDLGQRRVQRYVLRPQLDPAVLAALPTPSLATLLLPIVVSGPFDDLSIRADPTLVVDQAADAAKRALDKAAEGDVGGAIEELGKGTIGNVLRGLGIRP
ncbi:MAG: AsmA family protein, partial [Pseudomonadota bacterium]